MSTQTHQDTLCPHCLLGADGPPLDGRTNLSRRRLAHELPADALPILAALQRGMRARRGAWTALLVPEPTPQEHIPWGGDQIRLIDLAAPRTEYCPLLAYVWWEHGIADLTTADIPFVVESPTARQELFGGASRATLDRLIWASDDTASMTEDGIPDWAVVALRTALRRVLGIEGIHDEQTMAATSDAVS